MWTCVRRGVWLVVALLVAAEGYAQERLTLQDALDLARQDNYTIQIARNQVSIAANEYSIGNAGFLPSLSLSAGQNTTLSNTTQTFLGDQGTIDRNNAQATRQNAGAQLNWTLFDGLGQFAAYNRLEAQQEQQSYTAASTIEAVLADVIVAYYDIVRQQQQLRVLEEAVAISEERLRIAEARRDLGSASELEVRRARVDLNTDRADMLRQEVNLTNAKATFNQVLARPASVEFTVAEEIDVNTTLRLDPLRQAALSRNPQLRGARQALSVAHLERREIRAERFPTVDLQLGYAFSNLDSESGFLQNSRSFDFSYGLSLNFDLFDGFDRSRRSQNARIRTRNAELTIDDLRTQIEADLSSFYKSYQNRLQLVELERENLEAARLNVDVALERFRLGTITSVELREVQEALTQAESRLITAEFEAKQAETALRRLSGQFSSAFNLE